MSDESTEIANGFLYSLLMLLVENQGLALHENRLIQRALDLGKADTADRARLAYIVKGVLPTLIERNVFVRHGEALAIGPLGWKIVAQAVSDQGMMAMDRIARPPC